MLEQVYASTDRLSRKGEGFVPKELHVATLFLAGVRRVKDTYRRFWNQFHAPITARFQNRQVEAMWPLGGGFLGAMWQMLDFRSKAEAFQIRNSWPCRSWPIQRPRRLRLACFHGWLSAGVGRVLLPDRPQPWLLWGGWASKRSWGCGNLAFGGVLCGRRPVLRRPFFSAQYFETAREASCSHFSSSASLSSVREAKYLCSIPLGLPNGLR